MERKITWWDKKLRKCDLFCSFYHLLLPPTMSKEHLGGEVDPLAWFNASNENICEAKPSMLANSH